VYWLQRNLSSEVQPSEMVLGCVWCCVSQATAEAVREHLGAIPGGF
jgi:uroporphyrinogen-III synthase